MIAPIKSPKVSRCPPGIRRARQLVASALLPQRPRPVQPVPSVPAWRAWSFTAWVTAVVAAYFAYMAGLF
jgi:hypothetical protein